MNMEKYDVRELVEKIYELDVKVYEATGSTMGKVFPAGKYLSIFYKGPSTRTKVAVDRLIASANEHHLKITGDPIEFCHIDDYETSVDEECLTEIQIPVK